MEEAPKNNLTIPVAIVVAGLLIAGAIFITQGDSAPTGAVAKEKIAVTPEPTPSTELSIPLFSEATDHIRGNPDAPVILVEYSDTECPFCKSFHNTLKQLIERYGKAGSFAWVYRHFPLVQLHPKAPKEAEALECAAEFGGNAKFWEYIDALFIATPSNNNLDPSELPRIAERVGLQKDSFDQCLVSGRHQSRVRKEYAEAAAAGGNGTPFSILLLKRSATAESKTRILSLYERFRDPRTGELPIAFSSDGLKISLSGAMPYELMKATIGELLK